MGVTRAQMDSRDETVNIAVRLPRRLHEALRRRVSRRHSISLEHEIVAILRGELPPVMPETLADNRFVEGVGDLETLAAQQGVAPVTDPGALAGDFWPQDEKTEELLATIRQWREEGRRRCSG